MRAIELLAVFRYRNLATGVILCSLFSTATAERYFTQDFNGREGDEVVRRIYLTIASTDDLSEHRLTAVQHIFEETHRVDVSPDFYVDMRRDEFELFHTVSFNTDGSDPHRLPEFRYGSDLAGPNEMTGGFSIHRTSNDDPLIDRDWSQTYEPMELGKRSHFYQSFGLEEVAGRDQVALNWEAGTPGIAFVPTLPSEEVIVDGVPLNVDFRDELVSWSPSTSFGLGLGSVYLRERWPGDATLDDRFDSSDLVQVFQYGKYETGRPAGWVQGDWNVDGFFDSGDLVAAFNAGEYALHEDGDLNVVPEPTSLLLIGVGILASATQKRRMPTVA